MDQLRFGAIGLQESLVCAKPFLKWVGGKQQLLRQFEQYLPRQFKRYFEPFVGGGAVFFHLWSTRRLPKDSFLFDSNTELINAYRVVRDNVETLIELLAEHKKNHSRDYFYGIRSLDRKRCKLTEVEQAARMIYLNKTCYNGLYRVNSKGHFNAPVGSYKEPQIFSASSLRAASESLQHPEVECKDFREVVDIAKPGDFFYFDPPYAPVSKTANFTGYTSNGFTSKDQKSLAEVFGQLTSLGCLCMLSNSHAPLILKLYEGYRIETIFANRAVNSDPSARGRVAEVLVLNY